jgi:myo-inositol-1(or 4)-monophosphatase
MTVLDLAHHRDLARRAALVGADEVRSGRPPRDADAKGLPGDWVTDVDLASERAIRGFLAAETPAIAFHGEELGGSDDPGGLRWVVDPLDGTTNFVHRFPAVGVSVALVEDDRVLAGAVAAPFLGDVWHAAVGHGATWEPADDGPHQPCRVSERDPSHAIVATGFPFRRRERLPRYLAALEAALDAFEDLRRPGAACLDLAWVACGVFDGFFELGLAPWDVAAGGLLIAEAGGTVTDWTGGGNFLAGDILAAPPAVHARLTRIASASAPDPDEVREQG